MPDVLTTIFLAFRNSYSREYSSFSAGKLRHQTDSYMEIVIMSESHSNNGVIITTDEQKNIYIATGCRTNDISEIEAEVSTGYG